MAMSGVSVTYDSTTEAGMRASEHSTLARDTALYAPNTVFVNVYDITEVNAFLASIGIGAHHVGIQVYDREYHFGRCSSGTGVGTNVPCYCTPHIFREQYAVGVTSLDAARVTSLVRSMGADPNWQGVSYHLITNNCVHFAEALAQALLPPEVRFEQANSEDARFYRCWASEPVQLPSGAVVTLPMLVPPHTNRLTRSLVSYIPHGLVEKIDKIDRAVGPVQH